MHSDAKLNRPRGGAFSFWRGLFAALLLAAIASPALGAVVPLRLEEMIAIADDVVTVRCYNTRTEFLDGKIVTHSDLVVLDTLKGDMSGKQSLAFLGGTYKGIVMVGEKALVKDEEALLFLSTPYNRLPKNMRAGYDPASPLVQTPKVVGGWQGKFKIYSKAGTPGVRKGTEAVPADAFVARETPRGIEPKAAPEYGTVISSVRQLADQQMKSVQRKDASREITGVYGKFVIPATSKDPVVRAFDPLPAMAYMTKEELRALEQATAAKQAAATEEPKK